MKQNTIILKAEDFKYPSKEERKEAEISFPKLINFGFEYKDDIELIFQRDKSFYETNREVNLYWWDNCLLNKFGKLNQAYVNTYVNYQRDLFENSKNPEKGNYVHRLQFNFYSETFYYFLFSARDVIFQILNLYFDLDIKEFDVSVRTIKKNITDNFVLEMILKLEKELDESSKIRNSFTHRFPKNQKDYRVTYLKTMDSEKLSAGSGREMKPLEIMQNINESLKVLEKWINELRQYLSIKPSR